MLVHKNNLSVYSGVSKQANDLRLDTHCEEMINCSPSIPYGVRRRNPTKLLSTSILSESNQFFYSYDRGLSGDSEEQYVVTIDKTNGLKVFDVQAGEYRTVNYSASAQAYLVNSNPEIGFSAITIKDTTFIVNKDIIPNMLGSSSVPTYRATISLNSNGYSSGFSTVSGVTIQSIRMSKSARTSFTINNAVTGVTSTTKTGLAPARYKTYKGIYGATTIYADACAGGSVTVTVDGVQYVYNVKTKTDGYNIYPETVLELKANLYSLLTEQIPSHSYQVSFDSFGNIVINKLDGTTVAVAISVSIPSSVDVTPPALQKLSTVYTTSVVGYYSSSTIAWSLHTEQSIGSSLVNSITTSLSSSSIAQVSNYDKECFIWVQQVSVDTAFPYTFYVTLKETNGSVISSYSTANTTTTGVASDIAGWADGLSAFTAVASGSVVKITRDDGTDFLIEVSDTYGNQASSAWKGSVSQMSDMPKHFPFKDTIVKIDGVDKLDSSAYWVKYDGNSWVEWRDPNLPYIINKSTMPHRLVRNADFTFTFESITWSDMLVGDSDTQDTPQFIGNQIQDLFFVNGRLGILTRNGISLSQQEVFNNFFRTTILQLLDDSAITTYIDSSKSVGLRFAVELQGSVVLFGDKMQFALDASKAISPTAISVKPISGFEINTNVKPISSGDSVFFVVENNNYSSLYEMNQTTISNNIRAMDVSAHVPNYIASDVIQIASSYRDSTLFLRSRKNKNVIYVYKYFGTEQDKVQMAWSKWTFAMDINSILVFDKELYLYGERYDTTVPLEDFSLASVWDDNKFWLDETYWVDSELLTSPSFEKLEIEPYDTSSVFTDLGTVRYDSEIELSKWAITSANEQKEIRGSLLIKTAEISAEGDSNFYLVVNDLERGTSRTIPAIHAVNRKPFISGNANNMRIKIVSTNGDGFQINSISLEGQYNVRSKRV